ncbi:MAG: type II secretion system protein [Planctomycetes bacterium]|nr:type II secretion system protein [Planctomycetota bacterium]
MNRKRGLNGFTLVEVIVALGIAASALILLVTANQESLRRSVRSSEDLRLNRQLEAKLDEIRLGLEPASQGSFEELPGVAWRLERERLREGDLDGMERLTLAAQSEASTNALQTLSVLVWTPPPKTEGAADATR